LWRFAPNHDFGRFDDRHGIVAAAKLQFADGVARDDGSQRLIPNPKAYLTK
jgi:hypothetical protein